MIRIKEIVNYCIGTSAVDIGTDHGYLLIELAQNKKYNKLLGIEVNDGPLQNLKNNIKKNRLIETIDTLKSNGLKNINIEEIKQYENIIISGMGGDLITQIIKQDIDKFLFSNLVLQPNNNEYQLRMFLQNNNFEIKKENIVEENNKIYEIINAKYNGQNFKKFNEKELLLGKYIPNNKLFFQKWTDEYNHLKKIEKQLKKNNIEVSAQIENKINIIEKLMKESKIEIKNFDE